MGRYLHAVKMLCMGAVWQYRKGHGVRYKRNTIMIMMMMMSYIKLFYLSTVCGVDVWSV